MAYQSLQIFWAPEGTEFDNPNAKVDGEAEAEEVVPDELENTGNGQAGNDVSRSD